MAWGKKVNWDPDMSDRRVRRLARRGRLETRTQQEIDYEDHGIGKYNPGVVTYYTTWKQDGPARKAGVPGGTKDVDPRKVKDEVSRWDRAGFTVKYDKRQDSYDILDDKGKKVAIYTSIRGK